MDSWEWNKYAAAILSALVFVLAVHYAAGTLFAVPQPDLPGYVPVAPAPPAVSPEADAAKDAASDATSGGAKSENPPQPAGDKK